MEERIAELEECVDGWQAIANMLRGEQLEMEKTIERQSKRIKRLESALVYIQGRAREAL